MDSITELIGAADYLCALVKKATNFRDQRTNGLIAKYRRTTRPLRRATDQQRKVRLSQFTDSVNELHVAHWLLQDVSNVVEYEPTLPNCGDQSIDFRMSRPDGEAVWFDVKSIHPETTDDWAKYRTDKPRSLTIQCAADSDCSKCLKTEDDCSDLARTECLHQKCSNCAEVGYCDEAHRSACAAGVCTECLDLRIRQCKKVGGEIYHDYIASRQSMLKYLIELEEKQGKARPLCPNDKFVMVYCGNDFDWERTHLEDLVYRYRTKVPAPGDDLNAYVENRWAELTHTVDAFVMVTRPMASVASTWEWVSPWRAVWC